MSAEQPQLEAGIQALEAQRALLGDAVVDVSLAGLRARLAALSAPPAGALRISHDTCAQVRGLFEVDVQ